MQIGLKTLTFLEIVNYSLRILANATFSVALKNKGVGLPTIRKPKPYGNGLHKRFHPMHFTVLIASVVSLKGSASTCLPKDCSAQPRAAAVHNDFVRLMHCQVISETPH